MKFDCVSKKGTGVRMNYQGARYRHVLAWNPDEDELDEEL